MSQSIRLSSQIRYEIRIYGQPDDSWLGWFGEATAHAETLADNSIALPWLVLSLTGNPLAVGTVLATAGIPRALFMLDGGALTDRFTSRRLMINSNLARMMLTGLLAALVATNLIQLWMLYALALLFGLADAFFFPAQTSIVPKFVDRDQLQAGNAMVQGTAQLSLFVGPVVAGLLVSLLDRDATHPTLGIALAIAIDSFSFLASVTALSLMKIENAGGCVGKAKSGVLASIREGLLYVWNDATLRIVFPITLGINILINDPFAVGIPMMARTRFPKGAAALGLILSLFGGGALPNPSKKMLGTVALSVISMMGIGLAVIGVAPTMYIAAAAGLLMGIANGYANIMLITGLQQKVAAVGLNLVSNALAGMLIGLNITVLLVCAGSLMTLFTLSAAFSPAVRTGL